MADKTAMYLHHYNLIEKPFQITVDPKFLWLGEKHQEALAMLKYGVQSSKGFLLLTGDVGTGKTTLIKTLLQDLDDNVIVATVLDPRLETLEFLNLLAAAFGMRRKFADKVEFLGSFETFLESACESNEKVLLIIDEAQRITLQLLEEIRVLSNIERADAKLLNIFFVGQNEFREILTAEACRALRQRIAVTYQLNTLTKGETEQYVRYRLRVAGTEREIFDRKAMAQIHAFARGYPRLINIICDHALLTGYVRDLKKVNGRIVQECARELAVHGPSKSKDRAIRPRLDRRGKKAWQRAALYVCLLVAFGLCGYLFHALGYEASMQNAKRYYGQLFELLRQAVQHGW